MFESNSELARIVEYIKAHWPSGVKDEWQVSLDEYPKILQKVLADFTKGKTKGCELMRLAGVSGSGKTTQLLPAAEAYFIKNKKAPVIVAARKFVEYHPHCLEILDFYGAENLRKMTDEFATIMMFMTITKLVKNGYDIILDVTLLDVKMEAILIKMLTAMKYKTSLMMIAVNPVVTEKFLSKREWRHSKETEQEFIRATKEALEFYQKEMPTMRTVLWNVYDEAPVYDGAVAGAGEVFNKYSKETEIPEHDEKILGEAKIKYMSTRGIL